MNRALALQIPRQTRAVTRINLIHRRLESSRTPRSRHLNVGTHIAAGAVGGAIVFVGGMDRF
jgi:hypothetical protein